MRLRATRLLASAAALGVVSLPASAAARSPVVRAGHARFQVLTPTLIRAEYAQDGVFENRPTMMATRGRLWVPRFSVSRSHGWLVIRTAKATLRYRIRGGPFAAGNLSLKLGGSGRGRTVMPTPGGSQGNLGGWRRALDLLDAPVALNSGILTRSGWYVLDDTDTALLTSGSPGFAVRPSHAGAYKDWYLFAYGHDFTGALGDLRALSGPAPMLPRSAFGVWFSRYFPYSAQDYHGLLGEFRSQRVPLDTISIDTDYKRESSAAGAAIAAVIAGAPGRPYSWDGWEWNSSLFPDARGFVTWAHQQGLSIALNIHPSISTNDPKYPQTASSSGGLATSDGCRILVADPGAQCAVFDWTKPRQIAAYFALHRDFESDGADVFWLDWCCDESRAVAPGLTADTWINSLYAREQRARGTRWPAFSRVGATYSATAGFDGDALNGGNGILAEHRYTIQFTGDTCATWPMLAFEAQFTAQEANVGLPYVSHDIGSFHGEPVGGQCGTIGTSQLSAHLPDDLYARWVALGTFQPLDRLHSDHGDRLPWQYGAAANEAAAGFLRLREALNPYIYTLSRRAYDSGLPIAGSLYLQWPDTAAAYQHPSEYSFGRDMVVAPVAAAGNPAPATVWVPPGNWIDYFTGRRYRGPSVQTLSVPLSQMPVLVRAGAIVPTEPFRPSTTAAPQSTLVLTAYPGARASFSLYDDAGTGFGYTGSQFSWTRVLHTERGGRSVLRIEPPVGGFPGALRARSWIVRFPGVARPGSVRVNAQRVGRARWSYDASTRTVSVATGAISTRRAVTVAVR